MFYFNKNAIRNKLQHYKMAMLSFLQTIKQKENVALQNKKIDVASKDSFPASDPPGHISHSIEDARTH